MSPKNKIKLSKLRKKLDKLDYQLLKIIKKRTAIIKQVITLKSNKNEIVDKKRISTILNQIKADEKNAEDNKRKEKAMQYLKEELKNINNRPIAACDQISPKFLNITLVQWSFIYALVSFLFLTNFFSIFAL